MLGTVKLKQSWVWGAHGKHPVGRDYFKVGVDDSFLQAFSDWVEIGYEKLNRDREANPELNSWRFWARGPKKGSLVCGVCRDSSDAIGRPYPFLIMGTGPLKGWEKRWNLLPLVFEKIWDRIEYLAAGRFMDLKQLEDEVLNMQSPSAEWKELESQIGNPKEFEASLYSRFQQNLGNIYEIINSSKENAEAFIPLNREQADGHIDFISLLHFLIKKTHGKAVPNSIFMGGVPDKTGLAVFLRALAPDDFIRLWSAWEAVRECHFAQTLRYS